MAIWKNPVDNSLHDDMNGAALSLPTWPRDLVLLTDAEAHAAQNPTPTADDLKASAEFKIQLALDTFAQTWGYNDLVSAASYANSTVAKFKAEALALVSWRDSVWVWAETDLAAITAGTTPMPSDVNAFISGMPSAPSRPS